MRKEPCNEIDSCAGINTVNLQKINGEYLGKLEFIIKDGKIVDFTYCGELPTGNFTFRRVPPPERFSEKKIFKEKEGIV